MSALNLGHFSYQCRRESLPKDEKENSLHSARKKLGVTPNKAPFTQTPNSISETPDSLLPAARASASRDTPTTVSAASKRESSMVSSEEDQSVVRPNSTTTTATQHRAPSNLFSRFQTSVRRKWGESEPVPLLGCGEEEEEEEAEGEGEESKWRRVEKKASLSQAVLRFEYAPRRQDWRDSSTAATAAAGRKRPSQNEAPPPSSSPSFVGGAKRRPLKRCRIVLSDDEEEEEDGDDSHGELPSVAAALTGQREGRGRGLDDSLEEGESRGRDTSAVGVGGWGGGGGGGGGGVVCIPESSGEEEEEEEEGKESETSSCDPVPHRMTAEDVSDLVCDSQSTADSQQQQQASSPVALLTYDSAAAAAAATVDSLEEMEKICQEDFIASDDDDDGYSHSQKKAILKFLSTCSVEEACEMSRCSAAKARRLVSCQPFASWQHLVEILLSKKGLSEKLLEGCCELLRERRMLGKLLTKCRVISAKMQRLNSSTGPTQSSGVSCLHQPSILSTSMQLKSYQLVGLNWLALLHSQNLNGILADEMGLGKTIQAVAFLAYLFMRGCNGPFLIVVPASTIDNWAQELHQWCPTFEILIYWGSQTERAEKRAAVFSGDHYHVILTTYTICIGQPEDRRLFRKLSLQCLVLDEGHMLKNMASQRYGHLMRIKAERRLLLTGTPVQNNLQELMSLLSFVMPQVFSEFTAQLKKAFSGARRDESSPYYQEQVSQARQIMEPFILRRLKADVYSELPAKTGSVELTPLTELQQQLYRLVLERARRDTKTQPEKEEHVSRSMSVVTEMRKVANHPLLLRHRYADQQLRQMSVDILQDPSHADADPQLVFEDMTMMTDFELHNLSLLNPALFQHTLPPEVFGQSAKLLYLSHKLPLLKKEGARVLLFSQFTSVLDIVEVWLQQEGHTHCRIDGSTPVNQRQQLIDRYNESDHIFIFLLSTRAGGLGINLTSANVVIIHDIDFNPYNDKQAEDRCHRMGQTREVHVTRLVAKGTIEEDILQCANTKLRLEQDISASSLTDEMQSSDIASVLRKALGFQ